MTIGEYIVSKFKSFGVEVSDADLLDISLNGGITSEDEVSKENLESVNRAVCYFIPSLLARPASISEGGYSISFNAEALKTYYSYLCGRFGIENQLTPKPKIKFL